MNAKLRIQTVSAASNCSFYVYVYNCDNVLLFKTSYTNNKTIKPTVPLCNCYKVYVKCVYPSNQEVTKSLRINNFSCCRYICKYFYFPNTFENNSSTFTLTDANYNLPLSGVITLND